MPTKLTVFKISVVFRYQAGLYPGSPKNKYSTTIVHEIEEVFNNFKFRDLPIEIVERKISIDKLRNYESTIDDATVLHILSDMNVMVFSLVAQGDLNKLFLAGGRSEKEKFSTKTDDKLYEVESELSDQLLFELHSLLTLSQIARPGSLLLSEGTIFVNENKHIEVIPGAHFLNRILEKKKVSYPEISSLDFVHFYKWLKDRGVEIKNIDNQAGTLQKVINIFSYLNNDVDEVRQLIYVMMALEQLYTDGKSSITRQLDSRIQLFLGRMEENTKRIKSMYDVRSKFLHGSIALNPYVEKYEVTEVPKYESEISNALEFGYFLLLGTVQKMYKSSLETLEFTEILKE